MSLRHSWPLDDPTRFYGFDSEEKEKKRAEDLLQQCIETINHYQPVIDRPFTSVEDQDYLNYLHHIFEVYHGLLDQQTHDFWICAPDTVRSALAQLNIAVHRCESLRSMSPRFVCTWFGMPKIYKLDPAVALEYGSMTVPFGSVCLSYVEIGKALEELAQDQDQYISDDAFQPQQRYSADFFVSCYKIDTRTQLTAMAQYINQHREFFVARGIENVYNVQALPLRFPVADLVHKTDSDTILSQIRSRQYVSNVAII
jgi:hypothetical protein